MSTPCAQPSCSRNSAFKCLSCMKNYCIEHLNAHVGRAAPLEEHILQLANDYNGVKRSNLSKLLKERMDKTRKDAHKKIDQFYDEQQKILDEKIKSPEKKLSSTQTSWNQYKKKGQITHENLEQLDTQINEIEKEINEIHELASDDQPNLSFTTGSNLFSSEGKPMVTVLKSIPVVYGGSDGSIVPAPIASHDLPEVNSRARRTQPNLLTSAPLLTDMNTPLPPPVASSFESIPFRMSRTSTNRSAAMAVPVAREPQYQFPKDFRTFNCSNKSGVAMASNGQVLLLNENQRLLLLNSDFKITQSIPWETEKIYDLTWIETIQQFLVITDKQAIYSVSSEDLESIDQIPTIPEEKWWSASATETHLYISTYGKSPTIVEFDPVNDFQMLKQFKPPYLCQNGEYVHQIISKLERIYILISNSMKRTARCDIRALDTFQLIAQVPLSVPDRSYQATMRCCLLPSLELLVIYEDHAEVLHVNKNGKSDLIDYKRRVWNVMMMNSRQLIVRTDKHLIVYNM